MHNYPRAAVERMMKVQEVILRAMAKKITWWQAAEIIGMSDRNMRRLHWRYREHGYDGLMDRRVGQPSSKRVPLAVVEQVFTLYREKYFDLNVRHFHEKLQQEHGIRLSYTWVKQALQGAGLVRVARRRGVHRRRRERRPLPGMLLHIDGSRHQWFQDDRWYDLLVILDDATSEIYYAQLVQEESTMTVLRALREVIEQRRDFLRTVQRPRQSLLLDAAGRRESGCGTSHAGGAGVAGNEHSDDSCVFAAGTRAIGTRVQNLARAAAAGAASAGHPHAGAGEQVSAGALRGRVQSGVSGCGTAARQRVSALHPKGSGRGVLGATATRGEPG